MKVVITTYLDENSPVFGKKKLYIDDESEISEKIPDIEEYLFAQYFEQEDEV